MNIERENRINAYVGGAMSDAETKEFERAMETNAALRQEVRDGLAALETAREWLESEPPGIERVDALKAPETAPPQRETRRPARVVSLFPILRRMSAAAAIFICGILIGAWMPKTDGPAGPVKTAKNDYPAEQREVTVTTTWQSTQPVYTLTSAEPVAQRSITASRAQFRRSESEDGKMIFENISGSSGTSSIWVIDSNFQIGNS